MQEIYSAIWVSDFNRIHFLLCLPHWFHFFGLATPSFAMALSITMGTRKHVELREERKNGERWARAAMRILTNRSVPRLRCRGSLFWSPGGAPRLILRNVFNPMSRWVSACPHPHRVVFSSPRVLVDALRSFESLYIEFISTPRNTHISMTYPLYRLAYFRRGKYRHFICTYIFPLIYKIKILYLKEQSSCKLSKQNIFQQVMEILSSYIISSW